MLGSVQAPRYVYFKPAPRRVHSSVPLLSRGKTHWEGMSCRRAHLNCMPGSHRRDLSRWSTALAAEERGGTSCETFRYSKTLNKMQGYSSAHLPRVKEVAAHAALAGVWCTGSAVRKCGGARDALHQRQTSSDLHSDTMLNIDSLGCILICTERHMAKASSILFLHLPTAENIASGARIAAAIRFADRTAWVGGAAGETLRRGKAEPVRGSHAAFSLFVCSCTNRCPLTFPFFRT